MNARANLMWRIVAAPLLKVCERPSKAAVNEPDVAKLQDILRFLCVAIFFVRSAFRPSTKPFPNVAHSFAVAVYCSVKHNSYV